VASAVIAETLKPRFLPTIDPTSFNQPVDIFGKWRGARYSYRIPESSAADTGPRRKILEWAD
jgi:hypothetical protein